MNHDPIFQRIVDGMNAGTINPSDSWQALAPFLSEMQTKLFDCSTENDDVTDPLQPEILFTDMLMDYVSALAHNTHADSIEVYIFKKEFPRVILHECGTATTILDGLSSLSIRNAEQLNHFREMESLWGECSNQKGFNDNLADKLKTVLPSRTGIPLALHTMR